MTELGDFLRAARSRLTPEAAEFRPYGERRRVPGLRRDEVAMLAGVSTSYYIRLEQGQSRGASAQVLDALATALRLDATERAHLHRLAAIPERRAPRRPPAEKPAPPLLELLDAIGDVPALVLGRRNEVLAWNPMGHALLAGHLPYSAPATPATRPSMTRMVFTDPELRALYVDWPAKARSVVGALRLAAARFPDDLALVELIGSLSINSPDFAALWSDPRVQACATAVYELDHPLVGRLTVTQQTLASVDAAEQSVVTSTVASGSPSAEALRLLAQLVADPAEQGPGGRLREQPGHPAPDRPLLVVQPGADR